jgi:pilus assembly protein Flp/PilA
MTTMITRARDFLTSDEGPTAVEYVMLMGIIVGGLVVSVPLLVNAVSTSFASTAANLSGS